MCVVSITSCKVDVIAASQWACLVLLMCVMYMMVSVMLIGIVVCVVGVVVVANDIACDVVTHVGF